MKILGSVLLIALLLAWSTSMAQQNVPKHVAQFPGACLKWVHIAELEIQQKHLDIGNYNVLVLETSESVSIILKSPDQPSGFGSFGRYPGYEVEISKRDGKIMSSAYSK